MRYDVLPGRTTLMYCWNVLGYATVYCLSVLPGCLYVCDQAEQRGVRQQKTRRRVAVADVDHLRQQ
jgi:hypothetical protein